jgi:hypothetical protein
MAEKLVKYFELVNTVGGVRAKMRLAMKTGITSTRAADEPDTAEILEKFYNAAKEFLGDTTPKL